MNPFNQKPPTELETELGSYMDPRENNVGNYETGENVTVTLDDETRKGFIAKQVDARHFLVKLNDSFIKISPGKPWLKVCRDYAHQSVEEAR